MTWNYMEMQRWIRLGMHGDFVADTETDASKDSCFTSPVWICWVEDSPYKVLKINTSQREHVNIEVRHWKTWSPFVVLGAQLTGREDQDLTSSTIWNGAGCFLILVQSLDTKDFTFQTKHTILPQTLSQSCFLGCETWNASKICLNTIQAINK